MRELADGSLMVEPEELEIVAWCADECVRLMDELGWTGEDHMTVGQFEWLCAEARRRYDARRPVE